MRPAPFATFCFSICLCFLLPVSNQLPAGQIQLAHIFGNEMIVQREKDVPVWGEADPGAKVTVTFAGQSKMATANKLGQWSLALDPMMASAEPRNMTITGPKNTITLEGVLVGDVWILFGERDNWSLGMYQGRFEKKSRMGSYYDIKPFIAEDIAQKRPPVIRTVQPVDRSSKQRFAILPQQQYSETPGNWMTYDPDQWQRFAGFAYFFGRDYWRATQVPVAIVEVLGGANLQAMTPPAGFCAVPELSALAKEVVTWNLSTPVGKAEYKVRLDDIHRWADDTRKKLDAGSEKLTDFSQPPLLPGPLAEPDAPTNYYNKSINPIVPFAARGFIIKPLQRNLEDPMYGPRARAMVLGLQDVFKEKDMPVAFFEMRPPMYWEVLEVKDQNVWPLIREKQHLVSAVPKTSILAAHNFGIDPRDTGFWGRVACRWALATVNGDTVCCGPTFRSLTVDDEKVVVTLDHVGKGLMTGKMVQKKPMQPTPGTPVGGFELADQQGQWHPAKAAISGPRVIIQCEKTARPSAIRYAWAPQPNTANLFNQAGFAALPWRAKIDK